MTMRNIELIFTPLFLILIFSCDRPECKNSNSVFEAYEPDTKEYKDELVRQLQMTDNKTLSYWLDKYETKNNKEYILVSIQGEELCARGSILVNNWKNLEGVKRTQGKGYIGAELKGLQIDIQKNPLQTELVLKDIDYIAD